MGTLALLCMLLSALENLKTECIKNKNTTIKSLQSPLLSGYNAKCGFSFKCPLYFVSNFFSYLSLTRQNLGFFSGYRKRAYYNCGKLRNAEK